jgi:hypothetical protein
VFTDPGAGIKNSRFLVSVTPTVQAFRLEHIDSKGAMYIAPLVKTEEGD